VAPREASVFFLMGRIYKKLNLPDQAMAGRSRLPYQSHVDSAWN
jgi:hypothetical protein